jgi:hypothetical protein
MKKLFLLLITGAITSVNAQTYQAPKDLTSDWKESSITFNAVESQEPTNNFLLVNNPVLDYNSEYSLYDSESNTDIKIELTEVSIRVSLTDDKRKKVLDSYNRTNLEIIDIDFGTVADFIIFTGTGAVANTGVSTVTGNVGSNAGAIAGFGSPSVLNGVIENANAVTLQASIDLAAACLQLQGIPPTITDHSGVFGSVDGETIFTGVYSIGEAVAITGTLTLDAQGDPDAVFIFQITGALNSVAGATVLLANGASSDNVFWIAVGAVGLGANTTMIGTAIGYPGAVSLGAGGSIDGRLYATVGAIATDSFEATIPVPAESDPVSSGNEGGLESNGDLASLIAKRTFKREKEGNVLHQKQAQNLFNKNKLKTTTLIDYLPETGVYQTEVAHVSSPEDLLNITNAKEVLSIDYYQGETRISAVLATITEGNVYDHSKVICDRLNNSSLEDIRTVEIENHKIISSTIKRPSGQIEKTLSFSIKMGGNENELFSFWNIDQFPAGNYQNYQIWGNSYPQIFSIANFIIDSHTSKNGLISTPIKNVLPNVFVKSGNYSNGVINLNIVNKTDEKTVYFVGNIAETEVSDHVEVSNTFTLSGSYNEVLSIETGVLFDIGFSLRTNSTDQKDVLYLADGPWGLDYLEDYATVTQFEVNTSEEEYSDANYEVDRNASASGEVKGNINLFRHLLPGNQSLNVDEFESVNFNVLNTDGLEIIIMQDEDREWENRLRYTIPINLEAKAYTIAFEDFVDASGQSAEITNIKTIVFSLIGDYTNFKSFNFSLSSLYFAANGALSVEQFYNNENQKIVNYPNPFSSSTTIVLLDPSQFINIQVFDLLGRTVDAQKINMTNNSYKVNYSAPKLSMGIYKYRLINDQNKMYSGTFIIK